jgi:hypothetical protein
MEYKVFACGSIAENKDYVGGKLVGNFKSERLAFEKVRELQFSMPNGFHYMTRNGDDVFEILHIGFWYHIVDKATHNYCYGMCQSEEEAIKDKAWCEKFHYLGRYY